MHVGYSLDREYVDKVWSYFAWESADMERSLPALFGGNLSAAAVEYLINDMQVDRFVRQCALLRLTEIQIQSLFFIKEEYGVRIRTVFKFLAEGFSLGDVMRALGIRKSITEHGGAGALSLRTVLQFDNQFGDGLSPDEMVDRLQNLCDRFGCGFSSEALKCLELVKDAIYPEAAADFMMNDRDEYADDDYTDRGSGE